MSQENMEIVKRAYEGVNARLEAPPELFDGNSPAGGTVCGALGLSRASQPREKPCTTSDAT